MANVVTNGCVSVDLTQALCLMSAEVVAECNLLMHDLTLLPFTPRKCCAGMAAGANAVFVAGIAAWVDSVSQFVVHMQADSCLPLWSVRHTCAAAPA